MRLVLEFSFGDECSYSCECTLPCEYVSAEKLLIDFEQQVKLKKDFTLASYQFYWTDFIVNNIYYPPAVYTVDEWFAAHNQG